MRTQEIIVKNVVTKNFVGTTTSSTQNEITQKMNSNKNTFNISKSNNDKIITSNNSFYNLIEKQAKEFEEFGKRMSLDLQNCYKTYLDQQNENIEIELDPTDIEKLKKYEEKFISQLQLIDSLKARIEELESESAIRDQEINKIRREFGDFVKSNPVIPPTRDNKTTTLTTNSRTTFRSELSETQPSTSRNSKKVDRRNVSNNKVFIHEYVDDTLLMKCKICEKIFISNKEFNKHAKQEHDVKHICFNCSEVFQEKTFLGKHIGTQHTRYCDYCDKIFNMEASLERHVKEVHLTSQDDDIDQDDEVNYTTTNVDDYGAFYLHETIQENFGTIMKCKECEKTFNCHIKFRFHANEVHHYEWLCLVCCQVFTSRGDRARHMGKNHTQDFTCNLCTKSCYDKIGLHHHYRAKHPGEKFPYIPRQIPMTSSQSQSQSQSVTTLFIHENIPYRFPLNEKIPYQLKCKICEELFKSHTKFNDHARTLHGYKFLCNFCSQIFSQKGAKKRHSKEVHVFTCQVCQKKFRSDGGLLSHCKAKNHYSEIRDQIPTSKEPTFTRFGSKVPNELDNKDLKIKNVSSIDNDEVYEEYEENYNVKKNEFDESVADSDDDNITIEEDESDDDESEENSDSFDDDDTEDDGT